MNFFETSVRPVLIESCQKCHGPQKQSSGLRLDSRAAILEGGESGPAVVSGKPDESLLVQAVTHSHADLKMPPKGKLPEKTVQSLRRWVELGAPWGDDRSRSSATPNGPRHWAFTPIRPVTPPEVKDRAWVRSSVDAFVLARLEREGLTPSPPADRRTLIRRASIDLLGIPPTAQEIASFEADTRPDAFERLIDRLLASPQYGERWGRHWLDVARYADTKGYVFQEERKYPFAYTYRDYVIRSFNHDLSFDRFLLEQMAADQLDLGGDPRALAAMGFLTVGRRFLNDSNEIIDDRIDLIGRGLLGLSIACARCHDHKYDPIPTDDYYSLYGVFASSKEPDQLPSLDPPGTKPAPESADLKQQIDHARKIRDDFLGGHVAALEADLRSRFSRYLQAAYDLELNPRNPRLEERATSEKLVPQRLRTVIVLWKGKIESAAASSDPVLGPLHALAALPAEAFSTRAVELTRGWQATTAGKPGGPHPIVAKALNDHPPSNMKQAIARYVDLLAKLEARCANQYPRPGNRARPPSTPTGNHCVSRSSVPKVSSSFPLTIRVSSLIAPSASDTTSLARPCRISKRSRPERRGGPWS